MDRRDFLITTGGAVVAATSATAGAASAQTESPAVLGSARVLRLALPWADAPHGPADHVRRLARQIETMTGGRYRIEISAGQDAGADADLSFAPAHDFAAYHPAFAYFAGLPGVGALRAAALPQWLAVGGGQMLWDDLAGDFGWKPLLAGHLGEAPPLWSKNPITDLASLAGRKVSGSGLAGDVLRAVGAEPVALAPAEVPVALADGRLDAVEGSGLAASLASGVARAASFATERGINAQGTALALNIRLAVWNRLDEADQLIFAAAAAEAYQAAIADALVHEPIARRVIAEAGVTFQPWPADIAEAIARVSEATIAHVAAFDWRAQRIDHSYFAFRALIEGGAVASRAAPAIG